MPLAFQKLLQLFLPALSLAKMAIRTELAAPRAEHRIAFPADAFEKHGGPVLMTVSTGELSALAVGVGSVERRDFGS